jgi:hypothetical protein
MPGIPRHLLERYFGAEPRLLRAFEDQSAAVVATADGLKTNEQATERMQDASVIVLAANAAFTNERRLVLGQGLSAVDDGSTLTIRTSQTVPLVNGGFTLNLTVAGTSALVLPLSGTLATLANAETLSNKTLSAPKLSGLGNHADDTAAAGGGIPVGGVYRNGSQLMVRVS